MKHRGLVEICEKSFCCPPKNVLHTRTNFMMVANIHDLCHCCLDNNIVFHPNYLTQKWCHCTIQMKSPLLNPKSAKICDTFNSRIQFYYCLFTCLFLEIFRRAHEIINTQWGSVLESQGILDKKVNWKRMLALIPNESEL